METGQDKGGVKQESGRGLSVQETRLMKHARRSREDGTGSVASCNDNSVNTL